MIPCQNDTGGEVAVVPLGQTQMDAWPGLALTGGITGVEPVVLDTGYDNMMVGVVIFRNLAGGGGSGGPSFAASLQVKVLVGLEIVPRPTSVDRVFQKPCEQYNPRAL
jgi:hypothetical protein